MKKLLTFICTAIMVFVANAQQSESPENISEVTKIGKILDHFSFVGSIGSPRLDLNGSEYNLKNVPGSFSLGELGVAYKLSDRVRIGISAMGGLGNCNSGYLDQEGNLIRFNADDEDSNHEDEEGDDEGEECEDDALDNLSGTVTVNLFENIPIFLQATAGYSIAADATALSAMVGYSQTILSELGIYLGVRFSDVLYNIPSEAVNVTSSSGLKVEFGVNWNF
ncbi:MAG: hypothetical protein DHS20C17_29230 [Cyclobacteriaceae bacterium]|nr:MAG: hypothetical protein DHS20C17_29230 [Cyclobacteriaceae bacterium]